jgi:hypothetical protein
MIKTSECRMPTILSNARVHAKVLICTAVALLTTTNSSLYGDDTPKALCVSVSSLVGDIRPNDISDLSQTQQLNITYYLENLARSNLEIPKRIHPLKDRIFKTRSFRDTQLNLTLIFPDSVCESRCIGAAILPGPKGFITRTFSYHKNLVIRPSRYPFAAHDLETTLGSLVLLDEKEQSLIAFYDVFKTTGTNQGPDGEQEYARSDYSRLTPNETGRDFKNYFSCLQNAFEVNAPMPRSGAR